MGPAFYSGKKGREGQDWLRLTRSASPYGCFRGLAGLCGGELVRKFEVKSHMDQRTLSLKHGQPPWAKRCARWFCEKGASVFSKTVLVALAAGGALLSGCQTSQPSSAVPAQPVHRSSLSQGYSLLFQLLDDESNVSKLLWIKRERPEFGRLIKEISASASAAHKQLSAFAKADPNLSLQLKPLPQIEAQTREAISKAQGKTLLGDKGDALEVDLLVTQLEALNYGANLARVLAQAEPNSARRAFLTRLSAEWLQLHGRVHEMLFPHHAAQPAR